MSKTSETNVQVMKLDLVLLLLLYQTDIFPPSLATGILSGQNKADNVGEGALFCGLKIRDFDGLDL